MSFNPIRSLFATTILIGLASCTPVSPPLTAASAPTATKQVCQPSQILTSENSFPEIQVTMKTSGEMWALLFFDQAKALNDEKIVWRISGSGPLEFQAQNENGTVVHPIWGPDYHVSSSWSRPGEEYGTGLLDDHGYARRDHR